MISKVKSTKLVEIFFYVSDTYEKELKFSCERFSNTSCPAEAFLLLMASLLQTHQPLNCSAQESLLDSSPVITCSGKRTVKVTLAFRREKQLPFPEQLLITAASENDLNVFRNAWSFFFDRNLKEKSASTFVTIAGYG